MEFEFTLTLTETQSYCLREFLSGIVNTIFFNRTFRQVVPSSGLFLNSVEYPVLEDDHQLHKLIETKLDEISNSLPSSKSLTSPTVTATVVAPVPLSPLDSGSMQGGALRPSLSDVPYAPSSQNLKGSSTIKIKFYERQDPNGIFHNCWEVWNIKVLILQNDYNTKAIKNAGQQKQQATMSSQSTGGVLINHHAHNYNPHQSSVGTNNNSTSNLASSVQMTVDSEQEDLGRLISLFENNIYNILDILDLNRSHIPPITSFDGFPYQIEVLNAAEMRKNSALKSKYGDKGLEQGERGSGESHGPSSNNYYVQGEEILKSGFKFIKKMLSD